VALQSVLVLIPAYNESLKIASVVQSVAALAVADEILVIDDGSNDDTATAARAAGATVVSLVQNLGYGGALQTGYRYANARGFDVVVQIDGDGQHDAAHIQDLLKAMHDDQLDVVLGSRFMEGSRSYAVPLSRKLGMALFRGIIWLATGRTITDPTTGYQALNREVVALFATGEQYPTDYPDADVIILLHRMGFQVGEVPVRMFQSETGKSMHSGLRPVFYVFKMLLSIFAVLVGPHRAAIGRDS
jgi:glycosyltransferase involved in cell wall biosynthesis